VKQESDRGAAPVQAVVMPSCLCCGRVGTPKAWMAEHPEIYVCEKCHAAALRERQAASLLEATRFREKTARQKSLLA